MQRVIVRSKIQFFLFLHEPSEKDTFAEEDTFSGEKILNIFRESKQHQYSRKSDILEYTLPKLTSHNMSQIDKVLEH